MRVSRRTPSSFCHPGYYGNTPPIFLFSLDNGQVCVCVCAMCLMVNVKVCVCLITADLCNWVHSTPGLRYELQNTTQQGQHSYILLSEHLLTSHNHTLLHTHVHTHIGTQCESSQRALLQRWAGPDCVANSNKTHSTKVIEEHDYYTFWTHSGVRLSACVCVCVIANNEIMRTINENYKLALLYDAPHTCCSKPPIDSSKGKEKIKDHRWKLMNEKYYTLQPNCPLLSSLFFSDALFFCSDRPTCWRAMRVSVNKTERERERQREGGGERVLL